MNSVLTKNEAMANVLAARVMRVTFLVFTLVYILNLVGIFVIPMTIMTVSYLVGSAVLWLPTLLMKLGDNGATYLKYLNVVIASLFVLLISTTLTYHVPVIYVYGIAIASLYFSKKLNILATILSVTVASVGQILAFYLGTLPDLNFPIFYKMMVFGVVPKALTIICIAAIFTMLCSRTADMLGNLMGAEEQREVLENMTRLREQNQKLSGELQNLVNELAGLTQQSNAVNQEIAVETEEIMRGTKENAGQIDSVNRSLEDITDQMNQLGQRSNTLAEAAADIKKLSETNQSTMNQAMNCMLQISGSVKDSMDIIQTLGEESKEIVGIIQTITNISAQTKLLALNATIEAARAGEQGRGFAVVAEEIQKLSEQTNEAVNDIEQIIREVVKNTERSVNAMEDSTNLTEKGLLQIKEAEESTNTITSSNEEMSGQIQQLDRIANQILQSEKQVSQAMQYVHKNTDLNLQSVEQVTSATGESSRGTEKLVEMVTRIQEMAEQLSE